MGWLRLRTAGFYVNRAKRATPGSGQASSSERVRVAVQPSGFSSSMETTDFEVISLPNVVSSPRFAEEESSPSGGIGIASGKARVSDGERRAHHGGKELSIRSGQVDHDLDPEDEPGFVLHLEPVPFHPLLDPTARNTAPQQRSEPIRHQVTLKMPGRLATQEGHHVLGAKG